MKTLKFLLFLWHHLKIIYNREPVCCVLNTFNIVTALLASYMKPIPGSEIVGSAELRKHERENVTGGNFSHAFFFHVFSHFLRAWNRLLKLLAIICTQERTEKASPLHTLFHR